MPHAARSLGRTSGRVGTCRVCVGRPRERLPSHTSSRATVSCHGTDALYRTVLTEARAHKHTPHLPIRSSDFVFLRAQEGTMGHTHRTVYAFMYAS